MTHPHADAARRNAGGSRTVSSRDHPLQRALADADGLGDLSDRQDAVDDERALFQR